MIEAGEDGKLSITGVQSDRCRSDCQLLWQASGLFFEIGAGEWRESLKQERSGPDQGFGFPVINWLVSLLSQTAPLAIADVEKKIPLLKRGMGMALSWASLAGCVRSAKGALRCLCMVEEVSVQRPLAAMVYFDHDIPCKCKLWSATKGIVLVGLLGSQIPSLIGSDCRIWVIWWIPWEW